MSDMISKMKDIAQDEFKSTYAEIKELVISEVTFVAKEKKSKKGQSSLVQQIMSMTAEEKELLKQILNK
jgi:chromosomal replication initiation ATPase DnaA